MCLTLFLIVALFSFFIFIFGHKACVILVPQLGVEPVALAMEAQS